MWMGRFLFADLPETAPEAIKELYELWRGKRRAAMMRRGEIPHFRDFENSELLPYSDNLAISTYSEERDDVFVETSGAAVAEILGVELTGKWFREVFDGGQRAIAERPYRAAAKVGRPTYSSTIVDQTVEISRLVLPLRSEATGVAFLVALFRTRIFFQSLRPHAFVEGSEFDQRSFLILSADLILPQERKRELKRLLRRVDSPAKARRRLAEIAAAVGEA